ncbi:MAG TPA: response regulator [Thermomicrobiales bacterium]|nr:response regulator [Thermomicrobiales bacterium]
MATETGHILVAEDDPDIAGVLREALAGEGHRVTVGAGGGAVAAARADPPDVVLLDLWMPGMDGAEVCRRLKADPRTRGAPVVFVTATPAALLRERLGDYAHEGLIRKPFDIGEVLDTVARLLDA